MQPLYLIASIGTRLIGVLSMLVLAHLMTPIAFGQFMLVNTNALVLYMLAGGWLISIANRTLVSDRDIADRQMMSAILSAALLVVTIISCAGAVYVLQQPEHIWSAPATIALATAFIIFDVTLAVNNALGREAAYARLALYRSVLAFGLSVLLVLSGAGQYGPVAAWLIGTAAAIVLSPSVRAIWSNARPSWASLQRMRRHLPIGLAGALMLGIYILANAPTRNIIAHFFGKSASGVWTLVADLFYGPLAVIANGYALSRTRAMYLAAEIDDQDALADHARALLEFFLTIAVPYGILGALFAADAMRLVLSDAQALLAADVAPPAAIQSGVLIVLYSLVFVALTRKRFYVVATMVSTTALAASVSATAGGNLYEAAHYSLAGTSAAVMFWLAWSVAQGLVRLRGREAGKLALASSALWIVAEAVSRVLPTPGGWIAAALAGAAAFVGVAMVFRLAGFIDALPVGMRGRTTGTSRGEL